MSFKLKEGKTFEYKGITIEDPRATIIACPVERVLKSCNCVLGLYSGAEELADAKANVKNNHLDQCQVIVKNHKETIKKTVLKEEEEEGGETEIVEEVVEHNDFDDYASDTAVEADGNLASRLYDYINDKGKVIGWFNPSDWESDEA